MRLTVFGKDRCFGCKQLEDMLLRLGATFTYVDIDKNLGAREYVMKRVGCVPLLRDEDTGGEIGGFRERSILELLERNGVSP